MANGQFPTTNEDTATSITLTADDGDPMPTEIQTLTYAIASGPSHGQITSFNPNTGDVTYLPDPNYNDAEDDEEYDSLTFTVTDDSSAGGPALTSSAATVTIRVNPVNDAPIASGASVTTDEDTPVSISVAGDDGDPMWWESQALTFQVTVQPTHGGVTIDPQTGEATYTPDLNYFGSDSFKVTVTDDGTCGGMALTSAEATVSITVNSVNDPPIAYGTGAMTNEDTPVGIALTGDDGDPETQTLMFLLIGGAAHGDVTIDPATGAATYTPHENYHGFDSFWFVVVDEDGLGGGWTSEPALVDIDVAPVNDPPVAVDDAYFLGPNFVHEMDARDNDYDVDGDALLVTAVTQPTYATVTLNGDGTITVVVDADFPYGAEDSFSYTLSDGNGGTDTGTVTFINYFSLQAEGAPAAAAAPHLNPDALRPIVAEARARWEEAGVGAGVLSTLDAAEFRLADLNGMLLAVAIGNTVLIDRDAAGFGWFVDATPASDGEFRLRGGELVARRGSEAVGRMDLLTAVMHEMGHLLGLGHDHHGLMDDELAAGVRRNPDADDLALSLAIDQVGKKRNRFGIDHFFAEIGAV